MGVRTLKTFIALALCLASPPVFAASWQEVAHPADAARLQALPQIRAEAIADAQHGEGRGDWRVIPRVLEPQGRAVPASVLVGDWRCRQFKLGRMSSYMVYDQWFSCNIRPVNGGLLLQKMNGCQRFVGFLFPEGGAGVSGGAPRPRGEPYHNYSGASPALGAQVTPDDQIGLLSGIGDNHMRLEIPAIQESLLDVVEFAR